MDWITPDNFKADFAAARRSTDSQIQMALDAAEDELIELVGQNAVTDTLVDMPTNEARASRLVRGHKFLAAATIVFNVDNIKRQQDAASPGTAQTIVNERFVPKELAELSEKWRAMAFRALSPYLLTEVEGDDYSDSVEYTHPETTDVCCITNALC